MYPFATKRNQELQKAKYRQIIILLNASKIYYICIYNQMQQLFDNILPKFAALLNYQDRKMA